VIFEVGVLSFGVIIMLNFERHVDFMNMVLLYF